MPEQTKKRRPRTEQERLEKSVEKLIEEIDEVERQWLALPAETRAKIQRDQPELAAWFADRV